MSRQQKWRELYSLAKQIKTITGKTPLVEVDRFFDGNDDIGSIAANLIQHPGIDKFYQVLKQANQRDDVQFILVVITDLNEYATQEETEEVADWLYSDSICIATTASTTDIQSFMGELMPDEIYEIAQDDMLAEFEPVPEIPTGHKWVRVWWD